MNRNENLQKLASKVSVEGDKVASDWCDTWNMGIEALKHKLSLFPHQIWKVQMFTLS